MKITIPLSKIGLVPLDTIGSASATDGAIQGKMRGRGVIKAEKEFTLVISNQNINDSIRINN